jgi:hypothetical protein
MVHRKKMSSESKDSVRRWLWRSAFLSFVLLPLLPEILIIAASTYAGAVGCQIDSKLACAVGPPSATGTIRTALQAANFIGSRFADDNVVLAWLASCYLLIILGWTRLSSRLLLALGASIILGFLPYFGPMLTIGPLANPNCNPNEGGIPPGCLIYGGDVGDAAHDAVRLGWKFFYGAPVALGAFVLFLVFMLGARFVSRRRTASRT